MSKTSALTVPLLALLVAMTSCAAGQPAPLVPASATKPNAILCRAHVRPNTFVPPKLLGDIRMAEPGDRSVSSGDFRFRVLYSSDRYNGRALVISVYGQPRGRLIEQALYQLDAEKGPANAFKGGHGFTGLHYVYAPGSAAELQYVCSATGAAV